ncbi:hypothetical protein [Nostoc sp. FACHB-110]|uniref:hypothetical protein n=1 Tax=Nostoc sp. FACHB-110 TaxID=2692834 RepID=UPI00168511F6|nr:hypothetical protein [Nostoc sp. FACHB-110]MBD2439940.1 hypothetical protein [Nostoc sp. FACHB-110]
MTRFIYFPIMASLLMSMGCQLALSESPHHDSQTELIQPTLISNIKVAEFTREIDDKTALNLVWKLPQVQRKAREIERLSRGAIKVGAVVDSSPTPDEPYYVVRIYEEQPDHDSTIYWFRVSSTNRVIEVLDLIENKYISLKEWQEKFKR